MRPQPPLPRNLIEYDPMQRRLWIFGQRCHHGATGVLIAALGCLELAAERHASPTGLLVALTGGIMMAHDWKDHAIWFERGHGSQPIRELPRGLTLS